MNLLVLDDPPAVGRLVRSPLAGRTHRASIAASADEARRKLDTGLFDALVIGAGGASREIAELLETEWPHLPLILAGVEREIPCEGPIVAVLTRPLRLHALINAVRALESRVPARSTVEAELLAAGIPVRGRVVAREKTSLLFEPAPDLASVGGPFKVRRGGADLDAELVFADARLIAVRVGDSSILDQPVSGGIAC